MTDAQILISALAAATIGFRLAGLTIGDALAHVPGVAKAFDLLPGCLIVSLICVAVAESGRAALLAAVVAIAVAVPSRSLVLTMIPGVGAYAMLQP